MSARGVISEGTAPTVDLDVLRRREPQLVRERRPLLPRVLLGLFAAGALVALYGAFVEPLLFPPREVRLVGVRSIAGGSAVNRRALAQAAGWLEAAPFPVTLRPLVPGVVARLDVLEGQTVKRSETVVAVLENPDLSNRLALAEAALRTRSAQVATARARRDRAAALLTQKADLRALQIAAEAAVRRDRESLKESQAALAAAEANVEKARVEAEAQRALQGSGGTPPISARVAEAALRAAQAEARMRVATVARMTVELEQAQKALTLAEEALAAPRALEGDLAVAEQEHEEAQAEEAVAEAEVAVARRNVDLLTVRSPVDGVVLRLLSTVGAPAGPMGELREPLTVGPGSSGAIDVAGAALALLYDPARLQARVEVPLADVGGLVPGGEVLLEVESVPGRAFRGEVLRLLTEANIQNNKLWVKVRLLEVDPLLRPEMLCRARFLAQPGATPAATPGRPRLEVPSSALLGDAVFVFDPRGGGRARQVSVARKGESEGWIEVEGSLGLSNEVILEPAGLTDGAQVRGVR